MNRAPTLAVERRLWEQGREVVVGVDEVGRGSWAGPIMVGAAVLPRDRRVYRVRDSKMLREPERERLFDRLAGWCIAWAVGAASQVECDDLGMARGPAAGRPPGDRGARGHARPGTGGRQLGLRGSGLHSADCQRRRHLPVDRHRLHPGQSHPGPDDASRGRALPRVRIRFQQGLPVPSAQDGLAGLRAVGDPSPHLDLHGASGLGRGRSPGRAPALAAGGRAGRPALSFPGAAWLASLATGVRRVRRRPLRRDPHPYGQPSVHLAGDDGIRPEQRDLVEIGGQLSLPDAAAGVDLDPVVAGVGADPQTRCPGAGRPRSGRDRVRRWSPSRLSRRGPPRRWETVGRSRRGRRCGGSMTGRPPRTRTPAAPRSAATPPFQRPRIRPYGRRSPPRWYCSPSWRRRRRAARGATPGRPSRAGRRLDVQARATKAPLADRAQPTATTSRPLVHTALAASDPVGDAVSSGLPGLPGPPGRSRPDHGPDRVPRFGASRLRSDRRARWPDR